MVKIDPGPLCQGVLNRDGARCTCLVLLACPGAPHDTSGNPKSFLLGSPARLALALLVVKLLPIELVNALGALIWALYFALKFRFGC